MIIIIYKTDVVRAYKGVIKEKEALEVSLRAVRTTPSRDRSHDQSVGVVSEGEVSGTDDERKEEEHDESKLI